MNINVSLVMIKSNVYACSKGIKFLLIIKKIRYNTINFKKEGNAMDTHTLNTTINQIAADLNIQIRNYSNMRDVDKIMVVSASLLTIKYIEQGIFDLDQLTGDSLETDGDKIYNFLSEELGKSMFESHHKIMMSCYSTLKSTQSINKIHSKLCMTPLKSFILFLKDNLVCLCKKYNLDDDYLGIFYSQFMRYSNTDKQNLGIIVTPSYITDLFTSLVEIQSTDIILDPCCGTGGVLIASLISLNQNGFYGSNICQNNLYGCDIQPHMFTITMTNLLLHDCATEHILCKDFFEISSEKIKNDIHATVGFMNPPYAQGKKDVSLNEICFVKHLLDSLADNARCAVIVPASTFVNSNQTNPYKFDIYDHHTLEGIITLNANTFYSVATAPVIAVFTAHQPHPEDKICKFINFENDGYITQPHVGRIYTEEADKKKEYLLQVWKDEIDADNDFCIKTKIKRDDEWLYNFYHSNLDVPSKEIFEDTVNKYFTFHFQMVLSGKSKLFEREPEKGSYIKIEDLINKKWGKFQLGTDFVIKGSKVTNEKLLIPGNSFPRVTTSMYDNAYEGFYSDNLNTGEKAIINPGNIVTIETAIRGISFYQPHEYLSSQHLINIAFKDRKMNQYTGLFLSACISNAIKNKYYYGYKFSKFRILKETIILPITDDGTIDFDYMEQYVKNLFIEKSNLTDQYKF